MQINKNDINKSVYSAEAKSAEAGQAKHKGPGSAVFIAATILLAFMLIVYMAYTPLPILEKAEEQVKNASSLDEIDMSLVADPEEVARQHEQLIKDTQEMYTKVRDEMVNFIKTGPINEAAIGKCEGMLEIDPEDPTKNRYGPNAKFRSLTWFIPESAEEMDLTLSPSEADKLIYLYSQMYDMDFGNGEGTTFEGWFYGIEGTKAYYPIEAFGNTYYYEGRGGYCLPLNILKIAKEEAKKAGEKAAKEAVYKEAMESATNPLMKAFVFLTRPFIPAAFATNVQNDVAAQAAATVMKMVYENFGVAAANTVIYTGIHDTMSGDIKFSVSKTPAKVWPNGGDMYEKTLDEFYKDWDAKGIVADYNSMPFKGRLEVEFEEVVTDLPTIDGPECGETITTTTTVTKGEYRKKNPDGTIQKSGSYFPGSTYYTWEEEDTTETVCTAIKWKEARKNHEMRVRIQAYDVEEWVDFMATAEVNGSSITTARQKMLSAGLEAIHTAGEIPEGSDVVPTDVLDKILELCMQELWNTDGSKYMSNYWLGWCAGFVRYILDQAGQTDPDNPYSLAPGITSDLYPIFEILTYDPNDENPNRRSVTIHGQDIPGKNYDYFDNKKITQLGYDGKDGYTAKPGDIIFWKRDNGLAHIGIVTAVTKDSILITQGNAEDTVLLTEYTKLDDGCGLDAGLIVSMPISDFGHLEQYDNSQWYQDWWGGQT